MKYSFSLPLAITSLAALSTALPQNPFAGGKTLDQLAPFIKAHSVKEGTTNLRPEAKRQIVRYGPWDLPAAKQDAMAGGHAHSEPTGSSGGIMSAGQGGFGMLDPMAFIRGGLPLAIADFLSKSMDPDGFDVMHQTRDGVCRNCTVLSAKMDVVFENGTRADVSSGVYLHHIIVFNLGEREMANSLLAFPIPFCAAPAWAESATGSAASMLNKYGHKMKQAVFGFGAVDEFKQMYTTPDGKFDSGFYFADNDNLFFQGEIVNFRPEPSRLYLQFDIEYVPGKVGKDAVSTFTSATSCDEPMTFKGGKGAGKYVGKGMRATMDGTIISTRGHMHDGGEAMVAFVNGKQICVSKAEYGSSYSSSATKSNLTTISKMTACDEPIPVKKGDLVVIEADYDTIKHPLRSSQGEEQTQMGLISFTFVPA